MDYSIERYENLKDQVEYLKDQLKVLNELYDEMDDEAAAEEEYGEEIEEIEVMLYVLEDEIGTIAYMNGIEDYND